jgi:hypothetical protein
VRARARACVCVWCGVAECVTSEYDSAPCIPLGDENSQRPRRALEKRVEKENPGKEGGRGGEGGGREKKRNERRKEKTRANRSVKRSWSHSS